MKSSHLVVVIPFRPTYVGGTGPPMAPVTLRPPHDEENKNYIVEIMEWKGIPEYIVSNQDNKAFRKLVKKQDILDWVSPRTLEDFEFAEAEKRAAEEWREEEEFLKKAREILKKRKAREALHTKVAARKNNLPAPKKAPGRPRKNPMQTAESEDEDDQPEEFITDSSDQLAKSLKRKRSSRMADIATSHQFSVSPKDPLSDRRRLSHTPSLSTPLKLNQYDILLDSDMEDAHESEFESLPMKGSSKRRSPNRGVTSPSSRALQRSAEAATSRVARSQPASSSTPTPDTMPTDSYHGSRSRSGTSKKLTDNKNSGIKSASRVTGDLSPPTRSSREALKVYEDLERQRAQESKGPSASRQKPSKTKSKGKGREKATIEPVEEEPMPAITYNSDNNEEELYEVNMILTHKEVYEQGKLKTYYLIDWVGGWEPSWEPEINIANETINDYLGTLGGAKKSARATPHHQYVHGESSAAGAARAKSSGMITGRDGRGNGAGNGKGKAAKYDDYVEDEEEGGEDSDDDEGKVRLVDDYGDIIEDEEDEGDDGEKYKQSNAKKRPDVYVRNDDGKWTKKSWHEEQGSFSF